MENEVGVATPTKEPALPGWLKALLVVVGMLLLLLLLGWFILDLSTAEHRDAELDKIEALGWPLELDDLYPEPIPDSENAGVIYRSVFGRWGDPPGVLYPVYSPEEWAGYSPEEQAQIRKYLDDSAANLELLHQAAQKKGCDFGINYSAAHAALLPQLSELRNCARLQRTAVIVALADGRSDDALGHLLDSLATIKQQEGERFLVCELLRVACAGIALGAVEAFVQSGELTEAHVDRLLAALEEVEAPGSMAEAMKGELVLGRDVLTKAPGQVRQLLGLGRQDPVLQAMFVVYSSPLGRPWRQHDQATQLELMRQAVQLGQQRYYQVRQQFSQWQSRLDGLGSSLWKHPLSSLLLPALGRIYEATARGEARVACARTALALERYRLIHGDYPDSLEALTPDVLSEIPLDPFDGKPVRYLNDGSRVVVYSVAENLTDDSGSEDTGITSGLPLDVVFTLRKAPTTRAEEERQ